MKLIIAVLGIAVFLVSAFPASGDTQTRLEVLRARAAVRVVITDPVEPIVTRSYRLKVRNCTRDVTITTQGGRELARVAAPLNCRKISERVK
jgi:hypothetical protein